MRTLKKSKKPCQTCKKIKGDIYSSEWENYVKMPNIKKYYKKKVKIDKKYAGRKVFYWAAGSSNKGKKSFKSFRKAYNKYYNSGLSEVDKNGCFIIYVNKPLPYQVKGVLYKPHIHYALGDKKGAKWEKKQYTVEL